MPTNTPSTQVGDIVVTGQRRTSPNEPFPKDMDPPESPLPSDHETIEPIDFSTVDDQQCSIPANRKQWNADARASEAIPDFKTYSAGQDIFAREHHAYLRYNGSTTELGNISVGPVPQPGTFPYVNVNEDGVTGANWMGDIHTHVSNDGRPSPADIADFNRMYALAVAAHRTDLDQIAMHIAIRDTSGTTGYRIYSYTKTSNMNVLGKELDPNATRCP